jgi:hypothetical protein
MSDLALPKSKTGRNACGKDVAATPQELAAVFSKLSIHTSGLCSGTPLIDGPARLPTALPTRGNCEAGQAIPLVAIGMVALLACLGLGIDFGYLRFVRREMQTAADAAALAGAMEHSYGDVTSAAKAASAQNGFIDGQSGVTVTVSNPPADGPHASNASYVEVGVSQQQPLFFAKIFNATPPTLTTRAVAQGTLNCAYALGGTGINVSLGVKANCGLVDNGDLTVLGCLDASSIGLVGTNEVPVGTCGALFGVGGFASTVPSPHPTSAAADPLGYLTAPTPPGGACQANPSPIKGTTVTLSPGNYCSAIVITSGATVTFQDGNYNITGGISISGLSNVNIGAGIYTLNGGGFSVTSARVNGTGVTFYNTGSGPVSFTLPFNSTLTAPTTGTYAGILFFQDRANSTPASFAGDISLTGAYYFPDAAVSFTGALGTSAYTIIVAQSISWGLSSFTVNSDYSSLPSGSPLRQGNAVLVE